ncbi:hypothetical protein LINPERHAP2_LOCUS30641 [Linum perenne]
MTAAAAATTQNDRTGGEYREVLEAIRRRATEAEERLSRIEAAMSSKSDGANFEHSKVISDLQSKIEELTLSEDSKTTELASERLKAQKLATENGKLQYRITHLIRMVRELNEKLAEKHE